MQDLQVSVDDETADALQTECELLGFDGTEAYLAWIVENRAAIEQGTESTELLAAYRERLEALESRLEAAGVDPALVDPSPADSCADDAPDDVHADASEEPAAEDGDHGSVEVGPEPTVPGDGSRDRADSTAEPAASDPGTANPVEQRSVTDSRWGTLTRGGASSEADGPTADGARDGGSADGPDEAGVADARDEDATDAPADEPADASDDQTTTGVAAFDGGTPTDAGITSMHLRPERVQRVNEDPVARDAVELADVTTRRVDELSRRAVAETREQLDRDVETGLSYSSSEALSPDVRPGEDLVDLESIDVPGRSGEVVAERREVVGRALAFLKDCGRARRSTFVEEFYEDVPAGYETADGWWRCVRQGLEQVDAVDGGHVWQYEE